MDNRTAALEQWTDDLEVWLANHTEELEVPRDENITFQTCLEDFENRAAARISAFAASLKPS